MGGNLLKHWNLPEKRIPTDDYNRIMNELLMKFRHDLNNTPLYRSSSWCAVAPSIRDKETHGDLDVCIGYAFTFQQLKWLRYNDFASYIEQEFGFKPFINSNVYSFPYDGFQVDVTFHPLCYLEMAIDYSSWGDLGNIMGRIFHKMGLHFGHTGLSFWIRQGLFDNNIQWSDSDHIFEKVVLTHSMADACRIGGFDYERWLAGFDTEKDAFDFVVNSKYFDPELFQLENLNHTNRTRNRKRGMYMRFIEYVNSNNFPKGRPFKSKEEYSIIMQIKFDHLHNAISRHRLTYEVAKILQQKLNGKLVMEWFRLTEKEGYIVGGIMKAAREELGSEILLELTNEEIKQRVTDIYNKIKEKQNE